MELPQQEKMPLFTVAQISEIFRISPQAVRFYHKKGLLIPQQRQENGYRQYGYNQIYTLAAICYLRRMGVSVDEIHRYLRINDAARNLDSLRAYSHQLRRERERLLDIIETLDQRVAFIEREWGRAGSKPEVRTLPDRYYVPLGSELTAADNELFFRYPTLVTYRPAANGTRLRQSFGAYLETERPAETVNMPVRKIRGGQYLTAYHQGAYSTVWPRVCQLRQEYSQYALQETAYCINVIDQFVESNADNYVVCLQIPFAE